HRVVGPAEGDRSMQEVAKPGRAHVSSCVDDVPDPDHAVAEGAGDILVRQVGGRQLGRDRQQFGGLTGPRRERRAAAGQKRRVVGGKDRTSLWLVPFAGGRPRRLTHGAWSDGRPRFSPDGRSLAFLSNRDDKDVTQLHVLPLDGGDASRLTSFKRSVTEAEWM